MKTNIRISLEPDVLDELERRSMAAEVGRSAYLSALITEQPLLVETVLELCAIIDQNEQAFAVDRAIVERARQLLKKCQTAGVQPSDGSGT